VETRAEASERPPEPTAPPREGEDGPRVQHPSCPYCHADVRPDELQPFGCATCLAWSHLACWEEHGSCAACGHAPGPVPAKATQSAGPQASPRTNGSAGRRENGDPWWVGRTSPCSGCSASFVVTNRYNRFKCPSCVSKSNTRGMLLFVACAAILVLWTLLQAVLTSA